MQTNEQTNRSKLWRYESDVPANVAHYCHETFAGLRNLRTTLGACLAFLASFNVTLSCVAQEAAADRLVKIESRLDLIEQRLMKIESALFASVRFSEAEARKQLESATASLKHSEKLYAKGLLSAFQMKIDRFNLNRAQALHRMCVDHEDHRKIGATLEVYDAKSDLERKRMRLRQSETMFERGFLARSQIEVDRKNIDVANKKLAAAQAKLKSLQAIQPATKQPAADDSDDNKNPEKN